jgi:XTP/dITP diphosphohydrolase
VIAMAVEGRAVAVASGMARGAISKQPRGRSGFGYDPIFLFEELGRTYAELTSDQKNVYSHRGRAFRRLLYFI